MVITYCNLTESTYHFLGSSLYLYFFCNIVALFKVKQQYLLEKVSKGKKVSNQNKIKTLKEISEAPKALTKA